MGVQYTSLNFYVGLQFFKIKIEKICVVNQL